MISMPMHTSTTTGVVQDIFLSLEQLIRADNGRPRSTVYRKQRTNKQIRMMTLYLIGPNIAAGNSTQSAPEFGGHGSEQDVGKRLPVLGVG